MLNNNDISVIFWLKITQNTTQIPHMCKNAAFVGVVYGYVMLMIGGN